MNAQQPNANLAEFDQLLARIHEIGREIIAVTAPDVDQKARFPSESMSALKEIALLSAYVPRDLGGMGLTVTEIAKVCEVLGHYCGSTAMIFAMHQIQVACVVHHGLESAYFRGYLKELVQKQLLMASATTEVGIGGDLRSSICAVEVSAQEFKLTKKAPVISYGAAADDIMVTCRRSADAPASDQLQVLVRKNNFTLEPISGWDTLGFRGTCSAGFVLTSTGSVEQILPTPFADVLSQTMHPYAHMVWGSLWLGIASDAVNRARAFVRAEARKNPSLPPVSSLRLAEVDIVLNNMRSNIAVAVQDYDRMRAENNPEAFSSFGFSIRTNNLKLSSSTLILDIVSQAMLICGIQGYRNDSKFSLGRHIRDAYGAAIMVNNDRIMLHNATMLLAHREG
jgi:acyl-CoA dehydrogenase